MRRPLVRSGALLGIISLVKKKKTGIPVGLENVESHVAGFLDGSLVVFHGGGNESIHVLRLYAHFNDGDDHVHSPFCLAILFFNQPFAFEGSEWLIRQISTSYEMVILIITAKWPRRVFGVTGGRPSSFQRSYGMGDPLAPDPKGRENSGGGGLHPSVTP
jgi:hypothetical protein